MRLTGAARLAGVVGAPVAQSLSPLIHGAWIAACGLDAAYVPFAPEPSRFEALVEGLRGGAVVGLNVTVPFKARALALASTADAAAREAGAANLLLFDAQGGVHARNTDGLGLIAALAEQAPGWSPAAGPVVLLGAGGAARGAAAALRAAGAPVRIANRTGERAEAIARDLGGEVCAVPVEALAGHFAEAALVVNATTAGLAGADSLEAPLEALRPGAVVMDMVYKPLRTPLLRRAEALDLATVDGLAMLIGQARPSFEALFGRAPPETVDVRTEALRALEGQG